MIKEVPWSVYIWSVRMHGFPTISRKPLVFGGDPAKLGWTRQIRPSKLTMEAGESSHVDIIFRWSRLVPVIADPLRFSYHFLTRRCKRCSYVYNRCQLLRVFEFLGYFSCYFFVGMPDISPEGDSDSKRLRGVFREEDSLKQRQGLLFNIDESLNKWQGYKLAMDSEIPRTVKGSSEYRDSLLSISTKLKNLISSGKVFREIIERWGHLDYGIIDLRARLVDENWSNTISCCMSVRDDDLDNLVPEVIRAATVSAAVFRDSVQDLVEDITTWLMEPHVKPDSERLDELLPEFVDISEENLYFVNRTDATIKLTRFHYYIHTRRRLSKTSGGNVQRFPLMDALFGMGKTTFSLKYLATLAQYAHEHFGNGRSKEDYERLGALISTSPEGSSPQMTILLAELFSARTLHVKFARSALAEIGSIGRVGKVMVMLSESLKNQWGVVLPSAETNDLGVFLSLIPKPVFIVFDEIGAAFEGIGAAPDASRNSHQLGRQKDQFVSFLGEVCDILASTDGVYYLLSGRADFMRYVGLRPEVPDFVDVSRSASPGEFERITLNPIRPDHIRTIIEHTREMGSQVLLKNAIQNTYPSLSLDCIANKIYQLTGGHPRCLMMCLRRRSNILDALPTAHMERLILRDVKQVIGLFPDAIRHLYIDHRNNTEINLLEMINLPEGKEASRGFLASFIHAGIEGENLTKSHLTIMPLVLEYLESYLMPTVTRGCELS